MGKKIRLFIAIDLPEAVKDVLAETAVRLSQNVPNRAIRWVSHDQMHLTLRFLGDTAVSQLPDLQQELAKLATQYQPFQLWLRGAGAFPNPKRPRVVWAGLAGDLMPLRKMQADIEEWVVASGWSPEKWSYNPHLTLGRVKDPQQVRGLNWDTKLEEVGFGVTAVQLMQSELRPSGPVYTVRQTVLL